jgi:hypothetical protein
LNGGHCHRDGGRCHRNDLPCHDDERLAHGDRDGRHRDGTLRYGDAMVRHRNATSRHGDADRRHRDGRVPSAVQFEELDGLTGCTLAAHAVERALEETYHVAVTTNAQKLFEHALTLGVAPR